MSKFKHEAKASSASPPPTPIFTEADMLGLHQIIKDLERTVKDLERKVTELTDARNTAQLERRLLDAELRGYKAAVRELGHPERDRGPVCPTRWRW